MAKIPKTLILILGLGLFLRLINLGQSFWLDEASQALMSRETISGIWFGRQADFHPPLFYILTHFIIIFGQTEIWLRIPSVIFAVANIYLLFLLVESLKFSRKTALLSALFLAINPYHIYYAQEFRSYMLLCLLSTWSMLLITRQKYLQLAIVNALLLYTHYSSAFLILSEVVYVTFYLHQFRKLFFRSLFITFLLYLPWIPQFLRQLNSGIHIDSFLPGWRNVLSISPWKTFPLTLFKLVAGRITFLSTPIYLTYIVFVLLVIFISLRLVKAHNYFLYIWALLPTILMIIVSFILPQNQPFRVIYTLPALMIILATSALKYPKLILIAVLYISIVGNLAYFTQDRLQREQWRQTISFLTSVSDSKSMVLVKFADKFSPFYWYNPNLRVTSAFTKYPATGKEISVKLDFLAYHNNYSHVYLLEYLTDLTDPTRNTENVLQDLGFMKEKTHNFSGVGFIYEYVRI